jgi:hypothetical protein
MPGDPHSGSKVWKAPDREIGKPGENRGKVIAHRDLQPTAALYDRENRCNLRSRLWAEDVDPVLPTQSRGTHGIIRKVIAQLKFRIFQKSCKFPPMRVAGPNPNTAYTRSSALTSRSNVSVSKSGCTSIRRPPGSTTASPQLGSCCFGDFLTASSTGTN